MIYRVLHFFTPLLHPIVMLWAGCLLGAAVFAWKKRKAPALALLAVALVISLIGSGLSGMLLRTLERPYACASLDNLPVCDAVVLLGGGHSPSTHDPVGFAFNEAGDRILTAVEVVRRGRAAVLVIGGGVYEEGGEKKGDARLVTDWIGRWGVVTNELVTLSQTHNTREEAVKLKELAGQRGWQRVILVTSAFHMRRTEAVFRTAGLDVVPVACDFYTVGRPRPKPGFRPFPRPEGFAALGLYLHEQVGMLVYRLRGWIGDPPAADDAPKVEP
jgi:uncharacterized SAM-binding protein YcdF (DUF218 family)